jgi:DNA-binding SARP family transcriptional activator
MRGAGRGVQFGLLGPLTVVKDAQLTPITAPKQRVVLAALLLKDGHTVGLDELADAVWGQEHPRSAELTLRNYIRRLRSVLDDDDGLRIRTRHRGYQICVAPGELDVTTFESLQRSARTAARIGAWEEAAALLREALSLWQDQPLSDVPSELLSRREAPRLAEMHAQATESRIAADLHLGLHDEVLVELRQLATANPLRERPHIMLMLALYRQGRQADALATYQDYRQTIIDELAVEPGPDIRDLHRRVLAGDPDLTSPAARPPVDAAGGVGVDGSGDGRMLPPVPAQIPATVRHFTAREPELDALTGRARQAAAMSAVSERGGTAVISAICGSPGVGKTALAIHFAHQVAGLFPDGELYVNLRGFGPGNSPLDPADAVFGFLETLAVPQERIPASPQAQAGLYRSRLAGKRMLILLDNARDAAQVRPLLPASPGCMVIITSRSAMMGLVPDGADLLTLDVLAERAAVELLSRLVGPARAAAEHTSVAELAKLCAQLPQALSIAAARAAAPRAGLPTAPLTWLVAELREARHRLDVLDTGDPGTTLRTAFSWSYQSLSVDAARMFRLLSEHPGPDITAPAAARLAGVQVPQAHRALGELTGAHLLTELIPGRFGFHDLLRAYSAEQAVADRPGSLVGIEA